MNDVAAGTAVPTATVAVVVKDRKDWMTRCLDSIQAQQDVAFEILIVDNGSTDGTLQEMQLRAATSPQPMHVAQAEGPLGSARNFAVQTATTEFVAFTDSDCTVLPGWLAAGIEEFSPTVGVVQGRTVPMRTPEPWAATIEISAFSKLYETCNIFYRRKALIDAGGFDSEMPHFGDDVGAGWRVIKSGWEAKWTDGAVVAHEVTYPGLRWWLKRAGRYDCWPQLARTFPELRDEVFFAKIFLNRRHIGVLLGLAGVVSAAGARRPWPLIGAVPILYRWRPRAISRAGLRNSGYGLAFDYATLVALLRSSVRNRTPVL